MFKEAELERARTGWGSLHTRVFHHGALFSSGTATRTGARIAQLLAMSSMAVARYLASPMLVSVWLFSCRRVRPAADTMMRCVFGIRKAAFAAFFFERHRFRCWKNCTEPVDCLMGPGPPGPPGPGVSEVGHAGLGTRLEATGAFGSLRSCCPGREDSERRGEVERSLHLSEVSGLL